MIFNIPGLSEKNKLRTNLLIDVFEYKVGKAGIKTPEKSNWVLDIIQNVHDKL